MALSTGIPELDNELEKETHVIKSSATPCYNEKFEFVAPHFRSVLTLTLVDAQTDRKLGVSEISIYAIQQRDADRYSSNWQLAGEEQFKMRDLNGKEQVGHFNAAINFKENTEELFLSSAPKLAMVGPDEAMSLERVRIHISRFGTIISSIRASFDRYKRLMDWENPGFTFAMLVLFVYFTLTIDAEYALCAPLFMAVALLSETWYYRHFGYFRMRWVGMIRKDIIHRLTDTAASFRCNRRMTHCNSLSDQWLICDWPWRDFVILGTKESLRTPLHMSESPYCLMPSTKILSSHHLEGKHKSTILLPSAPPLGDPRKVNYLT